MEFDRSKYSFHRLIHTGSSMAPTLREQDILHVFPINDRSVQSGDVISFITSKNSRIISHRVVSGNPFRLKTKGDNSTTFDTQYVDPKNIIGIVKYVKRNGKTRRIRGGMAGRTAAMKLGMMLRIRRVHIPVKVGHRSGNKKPLNSSS